MPSLINALYMKTSAKRASCQGGDTTRIAALECSCGFSWIVAGLDNMGRQYLQKVLV